MPNGWEPLHVIDLEHQGIRPELADRGHPRQALHVGRGEESRFQRRLDALDVGPDEGPLFVLERGLQPRQLGELRRRGDIVFLEEAPDRVLAAHRARHQLQARAQQVARFPMLGADHVGLRDQANPQQLREHARRPGRSSPSRS
jgi:hypothetical protein